MESLSPNPVGLSLRPTAHTSTPQAPRAPSRRRWFFAAPAAALLALAGFPDSTSPEPTPEIVSGAAQIRYGENGNPQRWARRNLILSVDPSLLRVDSRAPEIVAAAVHAWKLDSLPQVAVVTETAGFGGEERWHDDPERLDQGDLVPDGKNSISYRRLDIPGHRRDLALTVAYTNPETGEIVEADLFVNARRDFSLLTSHGERAPSCVDERAGGSCDHHYDLQSVLTHEMGHFFGLGEDFEDPLSTMYLCTSPCETHKRMLTDPDQFSASELYLAPASAESGASGCSLSRRQGASHPDFGPVLFALGLLFWRKDQSRIER